MEKTRTHYFPISGNRVYTSMLPNGQYLAYYDRDTLHEGMGHTRLAAIADLVELLSREDAEV